MNIPNTISCIRILLVPLFVHFYIKGDIRAAAAVLMGCALSDVLDGMIARRFNMVTDLGKILDPVADKLIQAAMMLCLALRLPQLWLLLGLHVVREVLLAAMGFYVMRVTGLVCSARWYGKLCTAIIYGSMLTLLAVPELPESFVTTLVFICAGLIVMCLFLYFSAYLRVLRGRKTI